MLDQRAFYVISLAGVALECSGPGFPNFGRGTLTGKRSLAPHFIGFQHEELPPWRK